MEVVADEVRTTGKQGQEGYREDKYREKRGF
jgi:hypothetical protein